jgi:hypothetical protein
MGVDIAKAALAAGNADVAPGPVPPAAPIASSTPDTRLRERSSWSSVSSSTMFGFTLALPLFVFSGGALYVLI